MQVFKSLSDIEKILVKSTTLQKNYKNVYTLDRMRALMTFLGNPQDKIRVVHIAGTSGKTSTSYYIARLLRSSGLKVGLTVSPHITDIRERAQINLEVIPESEYCKYYSEYNEIIVKSKLNPTYFELLVAFSYWLFAKLSVDFAVVEVGLGGTLDGTNVVTRTDKVCVIADIGYDHTQILGTSLYQIAQNKAGIIQAGNDVFTHSQTDEIMQAISERSNFIGSGTVTLLTSDEPSSYALFSQNLPMYQKRNWHLATKVYDYIRQRDEIEVGSKSDLQRAASATIPARMETFQLDGKKIILDGAHNPQKLAALFDSIRQQYPNEKVAVLYAMLKSGKEKFDSSIAIIMKDCSEVIVTSFRVTQDLHRHGSDPEKIASALRESVDVTVVRDPIKAFSQLLERKEPILLVTGSFYLITKIRPVLLDLTKKI